MAFRLLAARAKSTPSSWRTTVSRTRLHRCVTIAATLVQRHGVKIDPGSVRHLQKLAEKSPSPEPAGCVATHCAAGRPQQLCPNNYSCSTSRDYVCLRPWSVADDGGRVQRWPRQSVPRGPDVVRLPAKMPPPDLEATNYSKTSLLQNGI